MNVHEAMDRRHSTRAREGNVRTEPPFDLFLASNILP